MHAHAGRHIEREPLSRQVENMLDEARMVLPGVQALLGFQFIAILNDGFDKKLSPALQQLHFGSLALVLTAIGVLMAPAAYHRLAEPETISTRFVQITCRLIGTAMFLLSLGLASDFYVIANLVLKNPVWSAASGVAALVFFFALWFVFPTISRMSRADEIRAAERAPLPAE